MQILRIETKFASMNEFMKKGLFISLSIVLLSLACNKDNFETKPTLKLKSQNGDIIPINGTLVVEFDFTDKEGDVSDTIYVRKIRINQKQVATIRDSFKLQVPEFPKNNQGVIKLTLDYQNYLISALNPPTSGNPPKPDPDTLMIKYALKDKGNNISDTVTTGPIIVIR
jgi:hypothetical protein